MRDISRAVINSGFGCHIGNRPCNILMYADDIVFLAPSWQAQQNLLNLCVIHISMLSMSLNVVKTVTVIFSPYKSNCRLHCVFPSLSYVVILCQLYIVVNIWVTGCHLMKMIM